MNNFIILPDSPSNSITAKDIEKGVFRITVSSKHLFQNCPEHLFISIGVETFECKYKHRIRRSDTFSIGKSAMAALNLKIGTSIRVAKLGSGSYKIEKI